MRRVLSLLAITAALAGAAICATQPTRAAAESADSLFAAGVSAYEAGDYDAARDAWSRLSERGVEHPDLAYNLGNAYFKMGDLGRAVLWYERARRLEPRDEDVRENLALVRTLVSDQQLLSTPGSFRRIVTSWHTATTATESKLIASALYAIACLLAIVLIFRDVPVVARTYRRLSFASPARLLGLDMGQDLSLALGLVVVAMLAFTGSSWLKDRGARERARGVVVAEEISVYSGPSRDATLQFKIHEGTVVSLRDARSGWVRVDLPGDLTGWADATAVERI